MNWWDKNKEKVIAWCVICKVERPRGKYGLLCKDCFAYRKGEVEQAKKEHDLVRFKVIGE